MLLSCSLVQKPERNRWLWVSVAVCVPVKFVSARGVHVFASALFFFLWDFSQWPEFASMANTSLLVDFLREPHPPFQDFERTLSYAQKHSGTPQASVRVTVFRLRIRLYTTVTLGDARNLLH